MISRSNGWVKTFLAKFLKKLDSNLEIQVNVIKLFVSLLKLRNKIVELSLASLVNACRLCQKAV
jgi:hypothetical protein